MTDKLVVSLTDPSYQPVTDLTWPRVVDYARKIGADTHLITERRWPQWSVHYEKYQLADWLGKYKRILFVDGDVLIRKNALNIFQAVPAGYFGAMDEAAHLHKSIWTLEKIKAQFQPYGWRGPWNGLHFNSGVMVMDDTHKNIFEKLMFKTEAYFDQPFFNVRVSKLKIPFVRLDPRWNFLRWLKYEQPNSYHQNCYFLHFTGLALSPEEKAKHILQELQTDR